MRENGEQQIMTKGGGCMENKSFMTVEEVANELGVSKSYKVLGWGGS